jgi:WD40 repeat protein
MRCWKAHHQAVWSLAWSPDGRLLATGGEDGYVRVWHAADATPAARFRSHHGRFASVAFHPSGRRLAVGSGNRLQLRAVPGGRWLDRGEIPAGGPIQALAASPDGRWLIAGASGRVDVLDWDFVPAFSWEVGGGNTPYLAVSRDSRRLAAARDYGPVRVYDLATRDAVAELQHPADPDGHTADVHGLALSPDGTTLAAGYDGGLLRLWDVTTRRERAAWPAHESIVLAVAYHPTGRLLLTASLDGTVRLWEVPEGRPAAAFQWELGPVHEAGFAPDGLTAAVAGVRGEVVLWDVDV